VKFLVTSLFTHVVIFSDYRKNKGSKTAGVRGSHVVLHKLLNRYEKPGVGTCA